MGIEMEFMGYQRKNGSVGTRNYVGILSTVVCANEVADAVSSRVQGTVAFLHQQGCCQTSVDIERVTSTLSRLGQNPNLYGVLLISLGCESTDVSRVAESIASSGKEVEVLVIQEVGGATRCTAEAVLVAQKLALSASNMKRAPSPVSSIVLGLKCGSSDTTSGLAPNPALGIASDMLVEAGATSVLGEVTEFIGAEHILAKHAKDPRVGQEIINLVKRMEDRAKSVGTDIRGGQPTGGNIKGGLTTIEEKSLGAIAKAGNAPIQAVYEYGEIPQTKGLVVMDSPGREPEILTGLAASGCNVIAFTTGRGAPQGFPFVPVIKITGNNRTWNCLQDHMDLNVSGVMEGHENLPEAGKRIFNEILEVASGRLTKAEISGYTKAMDIYTVGPVI
jgi:altronate dehydratase large subunit